MIVASEVFSLWLQLWFTSLDQNYKDWDPSPTPLFVLFVAIGKSPKPTWALGSHLQHKKIKDKIKFKNSLINNAVKFK